MNEDLEDAVKTEKQIKEIGDKYLERAMEISEKLKTLDWEKDWREKRALSIEHNKLVSKLAVIDEILDD